MASYRNLALRITLVSGLIVAGLASTPSLPASSRWIVAPLLMLIVVLGTGSVVRLHPRYPTQSRAAAVAFVILPALVSLAALLLLRYAEGNLQYVVSAAAGLVLGLVLLGEYHSVDPEARWYAVARFGLNLSTYLVVFMLFASIYQARARTIQSATAIWLISMLAAFELFRGAGSDHRRTWLYASVAGLVVAEATWGLNYWSIIWLAGGAFLLFTFYLVTGVIQHYLAGTLNRRLVLEFGAVSVIGLALVFSSAFWLG